MREPPQVRGVAFLEAIRHVREKGGDAELAAIVADAGAPAQRVLAEKVRKVAWYGYDAYAGFLEAIDRRYGKGDGAYGRTIGTLAGKRDLGTVLKIYVAVASPERLIRGSAKIWEGYYKNAGNMWAVAWTSDRTVLRVDGFPEMARVHCRLMEGWMIATMESIGCAVDPGGRETACVHDGAAYHEFSATWRRR